MAHVRIADVAITHPERLLYPAAGFTKLHMVRYYDAVASWMLPHLVGRPLTLKQCAPDVDHCRYLRHSGERAPVQVRVVNIQEQTKIGDYMVIDDRTGLIALAQRNIEFAALLKEKGIRHEYLETEGDHSWPVWRRYLTDFAPLLFR